MDGRRAGVFITDAYLVNLTPFMRKRMTDIADAQKRNGWERSLRVFSSSSRKRSLRTRFVYCTRRLLTVFIMRLDYSDRLAVTVE